MGYQRRVHGLPQLCQSVTPLAILMVLTTPIAILVGTRMPATWVTITLPSCQQATQCFQLLTFKKFNVCIIVMEQTMAHAVVTFMGKVVLLSPAEPKHANGC